MEIKFHSFVDVITNSSTTIYMQCTDNTIALTKELIDSLLQVSESDKKAEDLFDFSIKADYDYETDTLSEMEESDEQELIKLFSSAGFAKEEIEKIRKNENNEWADGCEKLLDKIAKGEIEPYAGYGTNCNDWDTRRLIITAKNNDKFSIDLAAKINSIFSVDGERDG